MIAFVSCRRNIAIIGEMSIGNDHFSFSKRTFLIGLKTISDKLSINLTTSLFLSKSNQLRIALRNIMKQYISIVKAMKFSILLFYLS
jgi:hypothetical protein